MENRPGTFEEHDSACARVAARFPQRWLRGYVRSKLRRDPIYPAAYELFRSSDAPILDVGCGLGLLAFYLRERDCRQLILGLDLDARKIRRGSGIAAADYRDIDLRFQDVQEPIAAFSGHIVLFDVLHYLPPAQQTSLLSRLAEAVAPGAVLVIRECPDDRSVRFWTTVAAERFAQAISWNLNTSFHFPSRERITEAFGERDFEQESRPLWGGLPFNNQLFTFRRRWSEAVPAAD